MHLPSMPVIWPVTEAAEAMWVMPMARPPATVARTVAPTRAVRRRRRGLTGLLATEEGISDPSAFSRQWAPRGDRAGRGAPQIGAAAARACLPGRQPRNQ